MKEYREISYINDCQFLYSLHDESGRVGVITAINTDETYLLNIGELFVRRDSRSQKIASQLHKRLIEWAKKTGHMKIEIELAPKKGEELKEMTEVLEHFGYECINPHAKDKNTLLCYVLNLNK